jgi:release factor glutamine methyltransferase
VDRSPGALALADRNRRRLQLENHLDLLAGDWLEGFAPGRARFDVIASNPPYIPSADIDRLQPEIARYEPRAALDGGRDGLDCIRILVDRAAAFLAPGGALFLEIGHDQFAAVERRGRRAGGYRSIECRQDYGGLDRVACLVAA